MKGSISRFCQCHAVQRVPKTAPAAKVEASAPKRGSHSLSEAQTAAKQPPKRDGQAPHNPQSKAALRQHQETSLQRATPRDQSSGSAEGTEGWEGTLDTDKNR